MIEFEHYSYDNKVPKEKLNEIFKIITNNMKKIDNSRIYDTEEDYKIWSNTILNTKDYYINICYYNTKLVGFSAYMYLEDVLMISEIQISEDYQSKYNILKYILKDIYDNSDKNRYNKIYGTISKNNTKSKEVFTHIGFKNVKNILYEIDTSTIKNYIKYVKEKCKI